MVIPMQENEDKETKHPTEMTSDELLDYVVAPEVARPGTHLGMEQSESRGSVET